VDVRIDLARVRRNAEEISRSVGVSVIAVVKANAYGLGATEVVAAIADVVDGFCVFGIAEAREYQLWKIARKPVLCLGTSANADAVEYVSLHARPAVCSVEEAGRLRKASPALCVDTGMQRFACPAENVAEAIKAGDCIEAFTHAIRPEQVSKLIELTGGRWEGLKLHAAGSSLMHEPSCRLDAVRPGHALYRGAVRIASRLVEVHVSNGAVGYSGFQAERHGVILGGYSQGLRKGPCLVNGRRSRLLEVGMQTSFVECNGTETIGDEVVLIGDGLEADEIAPAWKCSPQEVLVSILSRRV
jgi:alanine racemase